MMINDDSLFRRTQKLSTINEQQKKIIKITEKTVLGNIDFE